MSRTIALILLAAALGSMSASAAPVGTSFSYQGELRFNGVPATATYDFEFALFNVASGGASIALDTEDDKLVTQGLFSVEIDFTDVPFAASQDYWLEVRVRDGGSGGGYQQLLPRQKVTPAPYSINARGVQAAGVNNAAIADAAVTVGKIAGNAVNSSKIVDGSVAAIDVDQTQVQRRVSGTCPAGSAVQSVDALGAVTCQSAGTGTVTSVSTTGGLAGGPVTTTGTLSIADGGVSSVKITDGTIVAADVNTASIQRRVTGTCSGAIRQVNADGTTACNDAVGTVRPFMPVNPAVLSVTGVGASSVTIGTDGLPLVALYAPLPAGDLVVVHCENVACTSVTATTIEAAGDVGSFNSIVIDSRGFGAISYYDATNFDLKLALCLDIACTSATLRIVDSAGDVGSHTSLALWGTGTALIAYHDETNGNLKLARCDDNTCATATIVTVDASANDVGNINALTSLGNFVAIAHHDATAGTLRLSRCFVSACGAATNTTADATVTSGAAIAMTRMANLVPVIFYSRNGEVYVIRCTDTACNGTAAGNPVYGGTATSLAATRDALGFPIFVLVNAPSASMNSVRCADLACGAGLQGFGFGSVPPAFDSRPSIALGQHGFPILVSHAIQGGAAWVCDNHLCSFGGRER